MAAPAPDQRSLDTCRSKRNTVEYDRAGAATEEDATELVGFTNQLRDDVTAWLGANHPALLQEK